MTKDSINVYLKQKTKIVMKKLSLAGAIFHPPLFVLNDYLNLTITICSTFTRQIGLSFLNERVYDNIEDTTIRRQLLDKRYIIKDTYLPFPFRPSFTSSMRVLSVLSLELA